MGANYLAIVCLKCSRAIQLLYSTHTDKLHLACEASRGLLGDLSKATVKDQTW